MTRRQRTRTTPRPSGKARPRRGRSGRDRWWQRLRGSWLLPALGVVAVLAVITVIVVWRVDRTTSDSGSGSADLAHIHGLGVNPANGTLFAASHHGVFTVDGGGTAVRVGDGEQDTMGFTMVGPDHFLASGHPASGQDGPQHLGLIESTDGGKTWRTLSLAGKADFHALRYRHGAVHGFNSVTGQIMVSKDKVTWENRSRTAVRDLVVSPADADLLVATGKDDLIHSSDGGRTWTASAAPALAVLDWPAADRLWGVTEGGQVFRSTDGGTTWEAGGELSGEPAAVTTDGDTRYVALVDGSIWHSTDQGGTWSVRRAAAA